MNCLKQLHLVLSELIEETENGPGAKWEGLRSRFGEFEREAFGPVSERVKNALALKYDEVRNTLIIYMQTREQQYLHEARRTFATIPIP